MTRLGYNPEDIARAAEAINAGPDPVERLRMLGLNYERTRGLVDMEREQAIRWLIQHERASLAVYPDSPEEGTQMIVARASFASALEATFLRGVLLGLTMAECKHGVQR